MHKKAIKKHNKENIIWQAYRLEGKVKNIAIKPIRKKKK